MKPDVCRSCGVKLTWERSAGLGQCQWCPKPAVFVGVFVEPNGERTEEPESLATCGCTFPSLSGLKHVDVCDGRRRP